MQPHSSSPTPANRTDEESTNGVGGRELVYMDEASLILDVGAHKLREEGRLLTHLVIHPGTSSLRIDGPCPRCLHSFSQTAALEVPDWDVRGSTSTLSHSAASESADFYCDCSVPHPGAPDGLQGCGARFNVQHLGQEV